MGVGLRVPQGFEQAPLKLRDQGDHHGLANVQIGQGQAASGQDMGDKMVGFNAGIGLG